MLINLSNHPSEKWGTEQKEAANSQYGNITDLPFPQIPAMADEDEVADLAEKYLAMIEGMIAHSNDAVNAVMAQGEFTFTYAVVKRLNERGIRAVSACSDRRVEESLTSDGNTEKRVLFEFVRFREYGNIHRSERG